MNITEWDMYKKKKGFTLVEMVVAMGVMAIVGTVVCTMVIYFSKISSQTQKKDIILTDYSRMEYYIKDYLGSFDSREYTYTVSADKKEVIIKNGTNTVSRMYLNGKKLLRNDSASGSTNTIYVSTSQLYVRFDKVSGTEHQLVKCEISENDTFTNPMLYYYTIFSSDPT